MSDLSDLVQRAARVLPGGVLGNHRGESDLEFVVREGRGAYLWDANGRRYLDYLLGSGPMLLGHAHPAVVEAVQRQIGRGSTYMLLSEPIIELAEAARIPVRTQTTSFVLEDANVALESIKQGTMPGSGVLVLEGDLR